MRLSRKPSFPRSRSPAPERNRNRTRRPARQAATAPVVAPLTPAEQLAAKNNAFDQGRSNLYTTIGTTSSTQTHDTIDALPQGTNATVEKVLLQAPGVSQDSAASGLLHVRNDHANVQFRINGVMLPDGVTGFGSILDTSLIGSMSLVTGALPAEFGLRTVGLIDITHPRRHFQQFAAASASTAAAAAPSNRASNMAAPSAASAPPRLPQRPSARRRPRRRRTGASRACNTSSPAAICKPPRASKIRCRRSTPSTISRSRKKASPICRPSSTPIRA